MLRNLTWIASGFLLFNLTAASLLAEPNDLLGRYEAYCRSLPCVSYNLEVVQQLDASRTMSGTPRQNTYKGSVIEDDGDFVAKQNYLAVDETKVIWNHDSTVVRKSELMCFSTKRGPKGAYETPQTPRDRAPYTLHLALRVQTHLAYTVQMDDSHSIREAISQAERETVSTESGDNKVTKVEYFIDGACAYVTLKFRMEGDTPLLVSISRQSGKDCVPVMERHLKWARIGDYFFIESVSQSMHHATGGSPFRTDTAKVDLTSLKFDDNASKLIAFSQIEPFPSGSMTYTFSDRSVNKFGAEMVDGMILPVLNSDGKIEIIEGKDGGQ